MTATDIVNELHRSSGMRSIDMPGARMLRIVTMMLAEPTVVEIPRKSRPSA